ncbi:MAG: LytTR family transcriptional regulator, partial [Acetatifactor sp.]|nr:LytTR family transcriptional regulator [Acetatifactor sp.]
RDLHPRVRRQRQMGLRDRNGFCSCHRSYIVNLNNIEQFSKTEVITIHKAVIPISRNSYAAFKEVYFNHMFK